MMEKILLIQCTIQQCTTNNSFDRMNSTNLYKKQVRRADAKFHYYVIVLNAPARVIQ